MGRLAGGADVLVTGRPRHFAIARLDTDAWRARLAPVPLSFEERAVAGRLSPALREAWCLRRKFARLELATLLGKAPEAIRGRRDPWGRYRVDGGPWASWSGRGPQIVLAADWTAPVGVDLETESPGIGAPGLTDAEVEAVRAGESWLDLWCAKEALFKASPVEGPFDPDRWCACRWRDRWERVDVSDGSVHVVVASSTA